MNKLWSLVIVLLVNVPALAGPPQGPLPPQAPIRWAPLPPQAPPIPAVGKSIRMLVVRHAAEPMADTDANLAIQGAVAAAADGLDIKVVGNVLNQGGIEGFQKTISTYATKDAKAGDVLIVHTIGHGSPTGQLMTLGARSQVVSVLSKVAEANNQDIMWWQLSCFAAAQLPPIESTRLIVVSSSDAATPSPAFLQGRIMSRLFKAMARKNRALDADGDGEVTPEELEGFIKQESPRCGGLFFARNRNKTIFRLEKQNGEWVLVP